MGVHIGSSKELKITFAKEVYNMIIPSARPIINGIRLLSSDNYILTDRSGLYLTAKESE